MELHEIEGLINSKLKEEADKINKVGKGLNKHFDIVHILLLLLAAICITSIAVNYFKPANPITPTDWGTPKEPKEVRTIERILVPGPTQIVTIEKPVIVERLKLPDSFKNNTSLQAIAAAELKPTKAGYNVVGTLNTKTGVGGILAKEKERSLMDFPGNLSLGTRYGLTTDSGRQEAQIYGKYQPLRIGNLYLGVYGEANSKPEAKAMVDLEYKFSSD